ncbi:ATP-binding protein [Candidatus Saccharibacteria bacterium]|nr:ATP-binding protein [Candidatus Saccharibacteria bacterium]
MAHSKALTETKLWKEYCKKIQNETGAEERKTWVIKVFNAMEELLKLAQSTFPNYTLHDRVHILNVVDCMGGLLGTKTSKLSIGEIEVLILTAALHDAGMVYSKEQREEIFKNEIHLAAIKKRYKCDIKTCSGDNKQDYLRYLHPFRVSEVIQSNSVLRNLFENKPGDIVENEYIFEVCKAHGLNADEIMSNNKLAYLEYEAVDLRFCSFILRLSDLLDFDNSRAPSVLFNTTPLNEKSEEEWLKHMSSRGFHFPKAPSTKELPFKAICDNPNLEHAIKRFLNIIDDELLNCHKNQYAFQRDWKTFPFPWRISREEIRPNGYESDDFSITMDQQRILQLFAGENLYSQEDVFVRELLQNSIDAILLRKEFDNGFSLDSAKIEIWDWVDNNGIHWFKIDDNGTGMTVEIIKNHFLKVGNSYYTSEELKRDWCRYSKTKECNEYRGISQFGIGFLSCFLCSDNIEISTKYFDELRNIEEHSYETILPRRNGLRLSITGLINWKKSAKKISGKNNTGYCKYVTVKATTFF